MNNKKDDIGKQDNRQGLPRLVAAISRQVQQNPAGAALPVLRARLAAAPGDAGLLLLIARTAAAETLWDEATGYARRLDEVQRSSASADLLMSVLFPQGNAASIDEIMPDMLARGGRHARTLIGAHLLKQFRFAEGFALMHAAHDAPHLLAHPVGRHPDIPWWDGRPLNGPLLVITEQSLGEEILCSSYLLRLVANGIHAVVEAEPRLIPLFRRAFPQIRFVSRFSRELGDAAVTGCAKTVLSDLGFLLHCADSLPNPRGWLSAEPQKQRLLRDDYRHRYAHQTLVGISWRSFRPVWGERHKSLHLNNLAATLQSAGNVFFSLQYGDVRDELRALSAAGLPAPHVDARIDPLTDLDSLAAQVAAMDIVVSTSNTTAHLAGALGVPTLLVLPSAQGLFPYWGYEGSQTPWYPALRIIRMEQGENPGAFDARIADALRVMIDNLPHQQATAQ